MNNTMLEMNYLARLFYWAGRNEKETGHVALKVYQLGQANQHVSANPNEKLGDDGRSFYASSWPLKPKRRCECCKQGQFCSEDHDYRKYQYTNIQLQYVDIAYVLDFATMFKIFQKKVKAESSCFSCLAELLPCLGYENCSVLVMQLLEKGGIKNKLPFYQCWGIGHLLLLASLQIFILETSMLSIGFYHALQQQRGVNHDAPSNSIFFEILVLILTNSIPFIIASMIGHCLKNRGSDFLSFKNFAQKRLVEIDNKDRWIGIITALVFGIADLSYRNWITPYVDYLCLSLKISVDLSVTLLMMILSALCTKKLLSGFLSCFNCGGYLNHPLNLYKWIEHINSQKDLSEPIRRAILAKEFLLLLMILLSYFAIYGARKIFSEDVELSLFMGILLGIVCSYVVVKVAYSCLDCCIIERELQQLQQEGTDESERVLAFNRQFHKDHRYPLEWYAMVGTSSALGMVVAFSYNTTPLLSYNTPLNTLAECFLTFTGTTLGLLIGTTIYTVLKKCKECFCSQPSPAAENTSLCSRCFGFFRRVSPDNQQSLARLESISLESVALQQA